MSAHVFETDCECDCCKGTGLYVGMAEHDGSAVVCHRCSGTGKAHIRVEYKDFDGRKRRDKVEHVVEVNPGICIGKKPHTFLSDFGGMPYEDWLAGQPFPPGSEMRAFTCPAWWYQSADHKRKPEWEECIVCGSFSGCTEFKRKDLCWKRFDREAKKGGTR